MFNLSLQSNSRLRFVTFVVAITTAIVVTISCNQANAQWLKKGKQELPKPLVDSEPFDLIILNDRGGNAILKVKPLGSQLPDFPLSAKGAVAFDLFADFDERLDVPNSSLSLIHI